MSSPNVIDHKAVSGRYHEGDEVVATILFHRVDPSAAGFENQTGNLSWALSYASTYFDRGEWHRENYRLVEVAVRGEIVASYRPKVG